MPGRRNRKFRGRGMGRGMGQGNRPVGMNDLKAGVDLFKYAKKLFIPVAAAVAADLKNPDGIIRKQLNTIKNKIPFKIHMNPEKVEEISGGQGDEQNKLPPLKIEASSKPIEK